MLETIINSLVLLVAIVNALLAWWCYRVTKAKALLAITGAFLWTVLTRIAVIVEVPWCTAHVNQIVLITMLLYLVAFIWLYQNLRKIYGGRK